jgi:hypothetical protein
MPTQIDQAPSSFDQAPFPAGHDDRRRARSRAEALDDALDRLTDYPYAVGPGMATHGPMGAEALSALGHDDLVGSWVEGYKARNEPIDAPPATARLAPEDESGWKSALGDQARLTDWHELFTRQLQERPWPDVLERWVPRVLPGYGGALTHGLLRTAHAVRGLESTEEPSPLGLAELARGLSYWAGTYKQLPGSPALQGDLPLDEAVDRLPRATGWTPIEAGTFARIAELDTFVDAVEALAPPPSIDEALSDLTVSFARLLVARPDVLPFSLIHAVTPVAGARTLVPYLPIGSTRQLYGHLWHVNAALTAGFVPHRTGDAEGSALNRELLEPAELVARAAEHRDAHVIKFTEACLREDAIRPDPAYRLAAQHVIEQTPPW